MTHADFLAQTIAEIAEEVPGFELLDRRTQQSVRELADEYFHDEYIPRLEGRINIPRYQAAIAEKLLVRNTILPSKVDLFPLPR